MTETNLLGSSESPKMVMNENYSGIISNQRIISLQYIERRFLHDNVRA